MSPVFAAAALQKAGKAIVQIDSVMAELDRMLPTASSIHCRRILMDTMSTIGEQAALLRGDAVVVLDTISIPPPPVPFAASARGA